MLLFFWFYFCLVGFILCGWCSELSGKLLLYFFYGNGFCGCIYELMLCLLVEDFDFWLCDIQGYGESDYGGCFYGWNCNVEMVVEVFEVGCGFYGDVQ